MAEETAGQAALGIPELFAQLESKSLRAGAVIPGTVGARDGDDVEIDLGELGAGRCAAGELDGVEAGTTLDFFVEEESTPARVSRHIAEGLEKWSWLEAARRDGSPVSGTVVAVVRDGLSVDIGLKAFCPARDADVVPVEDLEALIGQTFDFRVTRFDPRNGKKKGAPMVSRRALLEGDARAAARRDQPDAPADEHEATDGEAVETPALEEGAIVTGRVVRFAKFGAFVQIGAVDGLLHLNEMSWSRVRRPQDVLEMGQEIEVKVLSHDSEKNRLSLSMKALDGSPWEGVADRYPVGDRFSGKVVRLVDYGAFVELEPGVDGLIHVSEMSWSGKVAHPSSLVSVGQSLEAVVVAVDEGRQRIGLSLRQAQGNPWADVAERYPPGTRIRGPIHNIREFGIFVGMEEGIDGLVHVSDLEWGEFEGKLDARFEKGEQVEAIVLHVDVERQRISLGIKQLTADPGAELLDRLQPGDVVPGVVKRVADFGAFVEIAPGLEGLVHKSELADEAPEDPATAVEPGQEVSARVLLVDTVERKVSLSLRAAGDGADEGGEAPAAD
jgi:small subunit ribosomal protein S1